mmetsp:Transcript_6917/g.22446  ORF Transcript_6917/g.22446 Transcript_6917/m.22446 type:complete len:85 (+) Transcript_6917:183-437(+)
MVSVLRKMVSPPNEAFEAETVGFAVTEPFDGKKSVLKPYKFKRHQPGDHDVAFKLTHCGICHSDLHFVKNDLANSEYPMVPGHE